LQSCNVLHPITFLDPMDVSRQKIVTHDHHQSVSHARRQSYDVGKLSLSLLYYRTMYP
jgi:hypothetical protein